MLVALLVIQLSVLLPLRFAVGSDVCTEKEERQRCRATSDGQCKPAGEMHERVHSCHKHIKPKCSDQGEPYIITSLDILVGPAKVATCEFDDGRTVPNVGEFIVGPWSGRITCGSPLAPCAFDSGGFCAGRRYGKTTFEYSFDRPECDDASAIASSFDAGNESLGGGAIAGIVIVILLSVAGGTVSFLYLWNKFLYLRNKKRQGTIETTEAPTPREKTIRRVFLGGLILSWVFAVASTGACSFLLRGRGEEFGPRQNDRIGYGLFNRETSGGKCERYSSDYLYRKIGAMDAGLKTARCFAVMTCLLLSVAVLADLGLVRFLNRRRQTTWIFVRLLVYTSIWTQLLVFFVFAWGRCDVFVPFQFEILHYDCKLGDAGLVAVFNIFLLIILTALAFATRSGPAAIIRSCSSVPVNDGNESASGQEDTESSEAFLFRNIEIEMPESLAARSQQEPDSSETHLIRYTKRIRIGERRQHGSSSLSWQD